MDRRKLRGKKKQKKDLVQSVAYRAGSFGTNIVPEDVTVVKIDPVKNNKKKSSGNNKSSTDIEIAIQFIDERTVEMIKHK